MLKVAKAFNYHLMIWKRSQYENLIEEQNMYM